MSWNFDAGAATAEYLSRIYGGNDPVSGPGPTGMTMSAWFYSNGNTGDAQTILSYSVDTSLGPTYRLLLAAGDDKLYAQHHDGSTNAAAGTSTTVSYGQWQHAAARFNSSSSREVWLDGGSSGSNATAANIVNPDTQAIAAAVRDGPQNLFDGLIAEVAIWEEPITDDDITALSEGISPLLVNYTRLIMYWPLWFNDDPEPDIVAAQTSTTSVRHEMTINGSPSVALNPPGIVYPSPAYSIQVSGSVGEAARTPRASAVMLSSGVAMV